MQNRTKRVLAAAVSACAIFAAGGSALAGPLSYTGTTYSETFDALPTTGNPSFSSPGPIDVPSLPGWSFAQLAGTSATINFLADNGSSANLGLAGSFGATGSSDRSLGSAATTPCTPNFGFQIVNNTTNTFDQFTLAYNGEMWRRGTATAGTGFLTVSYSTTASSILNGTFTDVPQLRFNSPNTTAANGAVDGNAAGNHTPLTFTLATGFSWAPGQTLTVRWNDFNETTGADDWLSVDDLSFSATRTKQLIWNTANATGTWDQNTANKPWTDQGAPSHFTNGDAANLADTPGDIDINVDSAGVTPIVLNVTHAAHKYSLSGGPVGGTLTKTNAGTLVLKSPNAFSSTNISGGTVETQVDGAWGAVNINLSNGAIWKVTTNPQTASTNNTVNITGSATIYTETDLNMVHSINGANAIFTKDGPGLLWARHNFPLTGASEVHVDAGTLRDSDDLTNFSDGIPDNVILRIAAGATFDESFGNGEQFSALAGDGTYLGHHVANGSGHINFLNNTNATFTFNGIITAGTAGVVGTTPDDREILALRKNGIHTAVLTNPNSDFSGQVQINNGVLQIPHIADRGQNSPIGMGNIANNPATPGADITLGTQGATPETVGTLRYTGPSASTDRSINLNAGSGIIEVTNPAAALTFAGSIGGAGNVPLQKTGPGTLILTADNSFSGGIDVVGGNLLVNTTSGNGGGFGLLSVKNGATLGGTGVIATNVRIETGGTLAPGASVGTLMLSALDLEDDANLNIEGGAEGVDQVKMFSDGTSDAFTLNGVTKINLFNRGGIVPGDYVIIDYNNATPIADALSHFVVTNPNEFGGATLINDTANQDIVLRMFQCLGCFNQWNVDANGSWGVGANWGGSVPDGSTAVANLLGKITAPRTITLDQDRTVQSLNFDNANKYTIASGSGGTLTMAGNGGISVEASGSHEISAPVVLAGVNSLNIKGGLTMSGGVSIGAGGAATKTGAGALTISGAQNHGANAVLTVNQGTVNLNSNAGTAGSKSSSQLTLNIVNGGAGTVKVKLGANQDLAGLNVQVADANTQTLDLASPAGAGQFHSVTVYAANLGAAKTALYNAIVNANKAGAIDPQDGIVDSGLHAGAKIGLAEVGDHLVIRSTRIGDLNLDGNVTIADFLQLAGNFGSLSTATWQEGDLNYDGNVSIADFLALAGNFGSTYAGESLPISAGDAQLLADFAATHGASVPEPTLLALWASSIMLLSRRRRVGTAHL